jgi:hypothetical protein
MLLHAKRHLRREPTAHELQYRGLHSTCGTQSQRRWRGRRLGGWVWGVGGLGGGGARDGREGISVEMVRGWIECAERHKF